MTTKRSMFAGLLSLLFASGIALAQNQNCPRPDCPNPGQNCPRNGQCVRTGGDAAKAGPAAMNRGGRRGCGRAMNSSKTQGATK